MLIMLYILKCLKIKMENEPPEVFQNQLIKITLSKTAFFIEKRLDQVWAF